MVIGAIEPTLLRYALDRCQGNISKTADLLGLSRNTLRKKLQQHRMT
jgi:Fis family transcriptional regulator